MVPRGVPCCRTEGPSKAAAEGFELLKLLKVPKTWVEPLPMPHKLLFRDPIGTVCGAGAWAWPWFGAAVEDFELLSLLKVPKTCHVAV